MSPDQQIARLASRQFGVFRRLEALAAGFSPRMIRYRLSIGRWIVVYRSIYLVAGIPALSETRILAATWAVGPDAFASFDSAGVFWGFQGLNADEPHISLRGRRRVEISGIHVHRPVSLTSREVTRIGVVPLTTPLRTVIDLSGRLESVQLEDVLDDGIRRGIIDPGRALIRVRELRCSGRKGLGALDELLKDRLHPHASGSRLEAELWRLIGEFGLPVPEREFTVVDQFGRLIGRVDFAYPAQRIAIEVDGYAYHQGRQRFDDDRERHNRLVDAGWLPLVFTKPHIVETPDETIGSIRRALRRRRDFRAE